MIKGFEEAYGVTIINNAALFKHESNSPKRLAPSAHIKGSKKQPKFNAGSL